MGSDGTDPDNTYSMPEPEELWSAITTRASWRVVVLHGAGSGRVLVGSAHRRTDRRRGPIWQIDIQIDPEDAFLQQGTEDRPVIYWLDVSVMTENGQFGWKTRQWPDHFMDDAVWDVGTQFPHAWKELRYPEGHPYHGLERDSIDMAFALTFQETPPWIGVTPRTVRVRRRLPDAGDQRRGPARHTEHISGGTGPLAGRRGRHAGRGTERPAAPQRLG